MEAGAAGTGRASAAGRGLPDVLVGLIPRGPPDVEVGIPESQRLTEGSPGRLAVANGAARGPLAEEEYLPGKPWFAMIPYFILVVSALEVGVFACGGNRAQMALLYDPNRRLELWRLFTYMLLHADPLHLALNVVIQMLLATPLELEQGHLRTGLVYLGGGVAGTLGTSMVEPYLYVKGASAGVYALLISHLSNILLNFNTLRYKLYRTVAVAVLAVTDFAFSLYHHYTWGNVCPRVGLTAHCSGALAGLLLGLLLFRGSAAAKPAGAGWTRGARWTAAALLSAALCAAVACNVLLPPTPPAPAP